MNSIENLIYIIGGSAMLYSLFGNIRILGLMVNGHILHTYHVIICLLSPLIVWQHIYQVVQQMRAVNVGDVNLFVFSLNEILSLAIILGIAFILFPSEIVFNLENIRYKKYLKDHRRIFYGLVILYLLTVSLSNLLLESNNVFTIDLVRMLIVLFATLSFLINVDLNPSNAQKIDVNLRFPALVRNAFSRNKYRHLGANYFKLFSFHLEEVCFDDWQRRIYGFLDLLTILAIIFGFVLITVLRNL